MKLRELLYQITYLFIVKS